MSNVVMLIIALAVVVLPWVVGTWLANAWRMPDYGWKIGLVLFCVCAGTAVVTLRWPPKYGPDLSGGTNLVYDVYPKPGAEDDTIDMDRLVTTIARRINPGGVSEISVRPFGDKQIEIIVPNAANPEDARRVEQKISRAGTLEFRILVDERDTRFDRLREAAQRAISEVKDTQGNVIGRWTPMGPEATNDFRNNPNFLTRENAKGQWEILTAVDKDPERAVTGKYLTSVRPGFDEMGGNAVHFQFDTQGARLFGRLTGDNLPASYGERHLAIILDGKLYSAPTINDTITSNGIIKGRFTKEEVNDLASVLLAGDLGARLGEEPAARQLIDATLGPDTIRKGKIAMGASVLAVVIFMLIYYRFAGLVACFALTLNVLLTLAVMIVIKAAFTLPGLAGLVLTVGMAVDANVLIYERIREELARGAALRMAIRNGFSRAMSTIIDSNVTTILTALVLYWIGSTEVKGFAITLFIGLVLSMFTATFVSRVVFDVAERRGWIRQLRFMQIVGSTNFDFLGLAKPAIAGSLVVIAIGMAAVVARGNNLLNIDFTSGTQVTMKFKQPKEIAEVRRLVEPDREVLPDISVNYINLSDEEKGKRIQINTSNDRQLDVEQRLNELFGDDLSRQTLSVSDVQEIKSALPAVDSATDEPATPEEPNATDAPAADEPASETPTNETPTNEVPSDDSTAPDSNETAPNEAEPAASEPTEPAASEPAEPPASEPAVPNPQARRTPSTAQWIAASFAASEHQFGFQLAQAEPSADENPSPTADTTETATDAPPAAAEPAASEPDLAAPADASPATESPETEPSIAPAEPAPAEPGPSIEATEPATKTPPAEAPMPAKRPVPLGPRLPGEMPALPGEDQPQPAPTPVGPAADPFAGGTQATLTYSDPMGYESVKESILEGLEGTDDANAPLELYNLEADRATSGRSKSWELRTIVPPDRMQPVLDKIAAELSSQPYFPSVTSFGPKVAGSTRQNAILALGASLVMIIAYIWFRFDKVTFGIAAVVALVHDVLVTLGALALSSYVAPYLGFLLIDPFKIDLAIVAAFLTLIGFSLNDTIVIFDRIRELRGKSPDLTPELINRALNQTLSRTILTSLTVLMTVLILYIWGGQGIHGFAFALLVGVIAGTYSTVFIATPVLLWMHNLGKAKSSAGATRPLRPVSTAS
ncbi:MAG: protein translocase subunit SecD [Pirellulales bacterium]